MSKNNVNPDLPQEGFVRMTAILRTFGICKTSWWCGIKEGRFPKPVKLGPRTTVWRVEDIRALIASFRDDTSEKGKAS